MFEYGDDGNREDSRPAGILLAFAFIGFALFFAPLSAWLPRPYDLAITRLFYCPSVFDPYREMDQSDYAFFEIVGEDNDIRGYLFGSTHDRWGSFRQLPPPIRQAFRDSSAIVSEINAVSSKAFQSLLYDPSSQHNLGRVFPSGKFGDELGYFAKCEFPRWRNIHAALATNILSECDARITALEKCRGSKVVGFQRRCRVRSSRVFPDCTIEAALDRQADLEGKTIYSLESLHDRKLLVESRTAKELKEIYQAIFRLPYDQDRLDFSYASIVVSSDYMQRNAPFAVGFLIDDRHATWFDKIARHLKHSVTFFIVGAAHLPGENGIIEFLGNLGYRVVQRTEST